MFSFGNASFQSARPAGPSFSVIPFRHSSINSILKGSLIRIGLPSVLEPIGLMGDRKPDGLTLSPWLQGQEPCMGRESCGECCFKPLLYYVVSTAKPGSAATDAETDKCRKCNDRLGNYYFQLVAIEINCVYGNWQVHCLVFELPCNLQCKETF